MTALNQAVTPAAHGEMLFAARRLESENPQWIVIYGIYTKQFVGFPLFRVPRGTIAVAFDPETLTARIREIELGGHAPAAGRGTRQGPGVPGEAEDDA